HLLPGDARLQHVVGGTRQALNARVLRYLIQELRGALTYENAARTLQNLLSRQPPVVRYTRERGTDTDVMRYISARLSADPSVSRVARDQTGDLIGYQRPEVRQHIQEIVDYLDGDAVIFPNPIILALAPSVYFTSSRGPKVSDGFACSGRIEIPVPEQDEPKPG